MIQLAPRFGRGLLGLCTALVVCAATGCVCTGREGVDSGGGPGGDGGPGGGDAANGSDAGNGSMTDAAACETTNFGAEKATRAVDIIWIVDNSGSMDEEESYVQTNINLYASMVAASGLDYHVIMITDTSHINVPAPLGTDPTRFLAVNQNVDSNNALELLLSTYPLWQSFLEGPGRAGSVKHFVAVTDDESDLGAGSFTAMLGTLTAPGFPPTATEPYGFIFHAVVAEDPPFDFTSPCFTLAAAVGQEYIDRQTMTGGVFSSLCDSDWSPLWPALATAAMANTMLPCQFEIPPPPMGMTLDYDEVNLEYTTGGGMSGFIPYVMSASSCGPMGGWYYDDVAMPTQIIVCPTTCTVFMNDPAGGIEVAFGCQTFIQ